MEYTNGYYPKYRGHLATLTDCDASGIVIGLKIPGAIRLGIDLDTIDELNEANKDLDTEDDPESNLPLDIEDLEESTEESTHYQGLKGVLERTGNVYKELDRAQVEFCDQYLLASHEYLNGDTFTEYLKDHRIELNTVMALAKPQAFWNWLKWKLNKIWPERDYRRSPLIPGKIMYSPMMTKFIRWYEQQSTPVIRNSVEQITNDAGTVRGIYDDVDGFQDNITTARKSIVGDLMNELKQDKGIAKIDAELDKIMKNGNNNNKGKSTKKSSKQQRSEANDEIDEHDNYDDDYDGNEWDD